jgi:hypothetical protein
MHRRQYLTGASVGLLAGLVGCLDDSGSSGGNGGDAPEVEDRTGERAIDRAAGKLNDAAATLDELEADLETPEEVDFDPEGPRTNISEARGHLDTAEAELGDDRTADVETLRSYADALEGLVAVTVTVTDDTLSDDIETVDETLEADDPDVEEANAVVDERHAAIIDARERHAEADATIRELDADRLEDLAAIELAALENGAATLGNVVTSLETLSSAYDATLDADEGYGALERGREHLDAGEYKPAAGEFTTAESTFTSSRGRLDDGIGDAPEGLVDRFETARCQNRHLADAAGSFADAAAAAADRDPAADDHRADGQAALDALENCTA